MSKFLIIRFSSIGDIVLTTPVIRCLRNKFPDAEIHYLVKQKFSTVLEHNPYIDKLITLNNNFDDVIHQLRKEKYDFIIDLHNNLRSFRVKNSLRKTKTVSFRKLNLRKYLFTQFQINLLPDIHIVDRYMESVKDLGVVNDGKGLDYFVSDNEQVQENTIPTQHRSGFLAVIIGATKTTKKLPTHKLKELCSLLNYPVILFGGKEDQAEGESIAEGNVNVYNGCGKFSLNGSAGLLSKAKAVITHDTGLMHIAAAFHKPVISVWGNTVPAFGMYPYYGNDKQTPSQIVEVKGLSCRPCSKIGYDKCPKKHFRCMEEINVQQIADKVIQMIK